MPTVTLERAQRFTMTSERSGRTFDIAYAPPLPSPVTGLPQEDCPIFIVLDSSLTFGTALERSSMYAAMGLIRPSVIVGVGYPGDVFASLHARTVDFTPETPLGTHAEMAPMIGTEFGGADDFIAFLIDELAPAIRSRCAEASPSRLVLHGFSLAALFSAYALMKRPEAFEAISIVSPSLWWNGFAVLKLLPGLEARLAETGARPDILVAVGAREQDLPHKAPPALKLEDLQTKVREARMVDAARDLAAALRGLPIGRFEYAEFDGEDHAGALTAGTGRAISFALRLSEKPD
jgi:predicted alpha/beta superfamily hydrolase